MPIGIDMNNYDISMGTGQIRMSGGGNMTMSSSSVTNQGIYYDISGLDARTVTPNYSVGWYACTYGILTDMSGFFAFPHTNTAANQVVTSPDGITWTARGGGSSTFRPTRASYGPDASGVNRIVVVGVSPSAAANSMTSSNGTTWTPVTIVNNAAYFFGVANGNGTFVTTVDSGSTSNIYYSRYPSISWTAATGSPVSANGWHAVTYGNGTFVAVTRFAVQTNQVAYSADGITWSYATAPTSSNLLGVAYGNGLFVAVGASGAIMTSPDGITWTARTSPTTGSLRGVAYGNGLFVALTYVASPSYCVVSQDGITWSLRSAPLANFAAFSIAYGQTTNTGINRFVAPWSDNNPSSSFTIDVRNTDISSNLAKNNVFLGNDISMTDGLPAGYNWMTQNQNISNLRGICYGVPTTGIYAGQGLFVGVSVNFAGVRVNNNTFSNVRTSVDGINWIAQTTDASANRIWVSVCHGIFSDGSGIFVAVAYNSEPTKTENIMTSPNGVNWTTRRSPNSNGLHSVTFGNNIFVAVCSTGTTSNRIIRSVDGINWTEHSAPAIVGWNGVTYGNGLFVAVGEGGYTMNSSNGSTWSTPVLAVAGVTNQWMSIVYGNGLFVATSTTGTGNRVMTSPDGITWTIRTSAADNEWFSIAYGNGLFVAASNNGTGNRIMISSDGINWTCRNVPNNEYATIAYGVVSSGIYAGQGIFVSPSNNSSNCIISVPGAQNNIAIGNNTTVDGLNSVAIGYGAKCTASNQVVIGSSGTNVGIGTSNPQFTLDVNGNMKAAGVFGLNIPSSYHTPNDGGVVNWIRVGTFTAPQGGNICIIKIYQNVGYTAITGASENNEVTIFFKTSNNQSGFNNPTGFAADSNYYQIGTSNIFDNPPIWVGNAPGISATQYTLYLRLSTYSSGTFYTAQITPANNCTWVNQYAHNSSPPSTVNSSTILVTTNSPFAVNGTANITSGIIHATSIPSSIPHAIGGTNFISYRYVNVGLSVGHLFEKKIAITRIGSLVYIQGVIILNPGANTTANITIPAGFTGTSYIQLLLNVTPTYCSAPNPSIASATGIITITASSLDQNVPNYTYITMLLGLGSAQAY
jgi:hypothetical protein